MPVTDADRFAAEIEAWLDKLYRAAYRLTQHPADAKELVQETCIRAFTARDQWLRADSRLGWLMRVQYNLFIDASRRSRRERTSSLDAADYADLAAEPFLEPEHCAEQAEKLALLRRAWRHLSNDQQAVLGLRAEGYSLAEMQAITGFGIDVLNARLHRARKSLARLLEQEEAARPPHAMENKR